MVFLSEEDGNLTRVGLPLEDTVEIRHGARPLRDVLAHRVAHYLINHSIVIPPRLLAPLRLVLLDLVWPLHHDYLSVCHCPLLDKISNHVEQIWVHLVDPQPLAPLPPLPPPLYGARFTI